MPSKDEQAARKGKAAEQLIAALCVLATGTELNALTALVDDEGVDLAFKQRDGTRTLDVQVKARFSDEAGSKQLREKQRLVAVVRAATFRVREDFWLLFVAVTPDEASSKRHGSYRVTASTNSPAIKSCQVRCVDVSTRPRNQTRRISGARFGWTDRICPAESSRSCAPLSHRHPRRLPA